MRPRKRAARSVTLLTLLGCLSASMPRHARAEAPACVDLVLPEALAAHDSWRSLLEQEAKPLAAAQGGSCARIAVLLAPGSREANALQVSWDTQLRTIPLVLGDLPAAQRPRAAALLARGMLQQLVHASDAAERERAAAKLAAQSASQAATREASSPAGNRTGNASERSRADAPAARTAAISASSSDRRSDAGQVAAEAPTKPPALRRTESATPPAAAVSTPSPPRAAVLDDEIPEPRTRRGQQWSGVALAGSTVLLNQLHPLIQFELGVQRRIDALHARVGLGLTGLVTQTRSLQLGGPGVRLGVEFALARSPLARVWLGPGGGVYELILARTNDDGSTLRSLHTVANVDARLNLELVISPKALLLLALEAVCVVRYLDVRKEEARLLAYSGLLVGLRVGAGF